MKSTHSNWLHYPNAQLCSSQTHLSNGDPSPSTPAVHPPSPKSPRLGNFRPLVPTRSASSGFVQIPRFPFPALSSRFPFRMLSDFPSAAGSHDSPFFSRSSGLLTCARVGPLTRLAFASETEHRSPPRRTLSVASLMMRQMLATGRRTCGASFFPDYYSIPRFPALPAFAKVHGPQRHVAATHAVRAPEPYPCSQGSWPQRTDDKDVLSVPQHGREVRTPCRRIAP